MAAESPAWRQLLSTCIHANSRLKHSSYLQLATVRPDGRPANRTVVFRGFVDGTDKLQFTTDLRSSKVQEIRHHAVGEICWYFTDSWEQFRIQGVLDVISGSEADEKKLNLREKAWFEISPRSRLQFLGPPPGLPVIPNAPVSEVELDPLQGPVDTFCLVTLDAQEVDYLHLRNNQRVVFKCRGSSVDSSGSWSHQKVNP